MSSDFVCMLNHQFPAEASRPEITIPRCIKSVFVRFASPLMFSRSADIFLKQWRILFFYVGGVFVIGTVFASATYDADSNFPVHQA